MKNYISKINDRNLQRKRESGLTTYALYSFLILILYKIIEYYPQIPFKNNPWEVLSILAITFNVYYCVIAIYSVYDVTLGHFSSLRVILKNTENERLFENVFDYSTFVMPLTCNAGVLIHSSYTSISWYFLTLTALLLLLLTLKIISNIKDKKLNHAYEIFEGTGKNDTDKDTVSIIAYLILTSIVIWSFYYLYNLDVILSKTDSFVFGLLLYSVPIIVLKITGLQKNDQFSAALENLEYEINVLGLTDEEIKTRLQKNYMGFLLLEWITFNLRELETFKSKIDSEINEIEKLKTDLDTLDIKQYPDEHRARKSRLEKREKSNKNSIENYFSSKQKEISKIWSSRKLESNERLELSRLNTKINLEYNNYKKK